MDSRRLPSFGAAHIAAVVFVFQSALALAGVNRWTGNGPDGGPVNVVVSDPTNSAVLYAGSAAGGVFKSINGGSSWKVVNTGLSSLIIFTLAVDPKAPSTIYAGTFGGDLGDGVVKSIDGGASWKPANTGLIGTCLALALDASNTSTIYAAMYWGQGDGGVFKSTDAGGSWTLTGLRTLENAMGVLAIDPKNPATVYAGGAISNVGLVKSTDGGTTWTEINNGILGRGIAAIAIDPITPTTVYAVTWAPGGVFKSTNGGNDWSSIDSGLPLNVGFFFGLNAFVIDPKNPSVLYVGYNSAVGVYKSTDGGTSWEAAKTGLNGTPVSFLSIDAGAPPTLYAATAGGVFKSASAGASWSPGNKGLTISQIQSVAIDPDVPATLYVGTTRGGGGIFKTTDGGATWTVANAGLSAESINAITIDPSTTSTLYAGDDVGGLFKSQDGGTTWNPLHVGSAETWVAAIALDPKNPSKVYVAGGGGLFRSADGGSTWSLLLASGPRLGSAILTVAVDPTTSSTLYAGQGTVFSGDVALFKSVDGGIIWSPSNTGLYTSVSVLTIDPGNPSILYAASSGGGIFKSQDAGGHWAAANDGLASLNISSLAIDPTRPNTVYASTASYGRGLGVFRSGDGGASWSPFNSGLSNLEVPALAIDRDGASLHIGTTGSGAFDFQLSEGTEPCTADLNTLCLSGSRFRVKADWRAPAQGTSGHARAASLTSDTGYFWFFNASNIEMIVKVLDGCGINGHEWVFAAGLTDVEVTLTVTDTQTGEVETYLNPAGTPFRPIQDTVAFASCPPIASNAVFSSGRNAQNDVPGAKHEPDESATGHAVRSHAETTGSCLADSTTLCLSGNRFRVLASWRNPSGGTSGVGTAVPLTGDTGYFWFFNASNVELIVKVLDACSFDAHKWVFAGGLTNVEVSLTVTDTQTGAVRTYVNPANTAFLPIQDTAAFGTCP